MTIVDWSAKPLCSGSNPLGASSLFSAKLARSADIVRNGYHGRPGDLVIGDDDGGFIVPKGSAQSVLAAARQPGEQEEESRGRIVAADTFTIFLGFRQGRTLNPHRIPSGRQGCGAHLTRQKIELAVVPKKRSRPATPGGC